MVHFVSSKQRCYLPQMWLQNRRNSRYGKICSSWESAESPRLGLGTWRSVAGHHVLLTAQAEFCSCLHLCLVRIIPFLDRLGIIAQLLSSMKFLWPCFCWWLLDLCLLNCAVARILQMLHAQFLCCRCSIFGLASRYSGLVRCGLLWLTLWIWLCTYVQVLTCDGFVWWLCRGKIALCWRSCWTWLVKQVDFCVDCCWWTCWAFVWNFVLAVYCCGIIFCILRAEFMLSWDLLHLELTWPCLDSLDFPNNVVCACVAIWLDGLFSSTFGLNIWTLQLALRLGSLLGSTGICVDWSCISIYDSDYCIELAGPSCFELQTLLTDIRWFVGTSCFANLDDEFSFLDATYFSCSCLILFLVLWELFQFCCLCWRWWAFLQPMLQTWNRSLASWSTLSLECHLALRLTCDADWPRHLVDKTFMDNLVRGIFSILICFDIFTFDLDARL